MAAKRKTDYFTDEMQMTKPLKPIKRNQPKPPFFDTLQLKNEFQTAGFSDLQAEAQVRAFTKVLQESMENTLATKVDLAEAHDALDAKIDAVHDALNAKINALDTKIDAVKTELHQEIKDCKTELRQEIRELSHRIDITNLTITAMSTNFDLKLEKMLLSIKIWIGSAAFLIISAVAMPLLIDIVKHLM